MLKTPSESNKYLCINNSHLIFLYHRASWLIIYLPMGSQPNETYQKVYSKLSADFFHDKPGDRAMMLILSGFRGPAHQPQLHIPAALSHSHGVSHSLSDLVHKLRECMSNAIQFR